MRVESKSSGLNSDERHDCTMSRGLMTAKITPVNTPSKARNSQPISRPIVTSAPVIVLCSAGSRYISKSASAGAGNTTVCLITLLIMCSSLFRQMSKLSSYPDKGRATGSCSPGISASWQRRHGGRGTAASDRNARAFFRERWASGRIRFCRGRCFL